MRHGDCILNQGAVLNILEVRLPKIQMQSRVSGARGNTRIGVLWLQASMLLMTLTQDTVLQMSLKQSDRKLSNQNRSGYSAPCLKKITWALLYLSVSLSRSSTHQCHPQWLTQDHIPTPHQFLPCSASTGAAGPGKEIPP